MELSLDARSAENPDAELVRSWLERFGRSADPSVRPSSVRRVAGGRSGSRVFWVEHEGRVRVLKVTTSAAGQAAARRELRCYQELAPWLPIRVPELIAGAAADPGTALLLSAEHPTGPAAVWSPGRWAEAAAGIGRLHRHAQTYDVPGWLRRDPGPNQERVAAAVDQWHRLGHPRIAQRLPGLVPELTAQLAAAPPVIVHGDCHVDNVLCSGDGELVWVDWQQVAVGAGPGDLALLWQRAEFDGAAPPREPMLAAYAEARGTALGPISDRLLLAAELRLLLVEWPHYLPHGRPAARQAKIEQVLDSHDRWTS